jgi:hypothetical protein
MKSPLAQSTAKSAKTLAQQIAKQIAREPLEVLKTAKEQTVGRQTSGELQSQTSGQSEEQKKQIGQQNELQDKMKSSRRMEALNRELDDIRKQDILKDLQAKITQGEEISLEEYPELSIEEKEVLKAQMEAVRKSRQGSQTSGQLIEPVSKHGRRFGPTRKQEAEKQQTHVEKPVPPSG